MPFNKKIWKNGIFSYGNIFHLILLHDLQLTSLMACSYFLVTQCNFVSIGYIKQIVFALFLKLEMIIKSFINPNTKVNCVSG